MPSNLTISGRYVILGAVPRAGGRSYYARHRVLGHEVIVHFLTKTASSQSTALLEKILLLSDQDRKLFIDAGEHESSPFVVSWHLPAFDTLAGWLDRSLSRSPVALPPTPESAVAAQPTPTAAPIPALGQPMDELPSGNPPHEISEDQGTFTRMFGKQDREPAGEVAGSATPVDQPRPTHPAPVQSGEQGAFTRMFGRGESQHDREPDRPTAPAGGGALPVPALPEEFVPQSRSSSEIPPTALEREHQSQRVLEATGATPASDFPLRVEAGPQEEPLSQSVGKPGVDAWALPSNSSYTEIIQPRFGHSVPPAAADGDPVQRTPSFPSGMPALPRLPSTPKLPSAPKLPPAPKVPTVVLKGGTSALQNMPVWLAVTLGCLAGIALLLILYFVVRA